MVGTLTRYVALAFGLAAIVALVRSARSTPARLRDAAIVAVACAAPLGAWTLHTAARIGRASERPAGFHPPHRRNYGKGLGVVEGWLGGDGWMDTNITIRTYAIKDGQVAFQAGGGIVADSDPAAEYEETLDKARALIEALGGTA